LLQSILIALAYLVGIAALFLLAWRDPRRLRVSKGRDRKPLNSLSRTVLSVLVFAPLVYAIYRGDAQDALVAGGAIFVVGWAVTVRFKVER
jgi:hypothetical protein